MKRSSSIASLLGAVLLGILASCSDRGDESAGSSEEPAMSAAISVSRTAQLSWIGQSALLLRADYPMRDWVLSRETGTAVPFTDFARHAPVYASPDGTRLLTWLEHPDFLLVAEVSSILERHAKIERLPLPPFPEMDPDASKRSVTFAFWLSDGRALIVRGNPDVSYERCYVYEVGKTELAPSPTCTERIARAGTGLATRVRTLPGDWLAFFSADEGDAYLTLARFTPEQGVLERREDLAYSAACVVEVHRDPQEDALYLESPVALDASGHCAQTGPDAATGTPTKLYRSSAGSAFTATSIEIPYRGELRTVSSQDLAWIDPEQSTWCTKGKESAATCLPLPSEVRIDPELW